MKKVKYMAKNTDRHIIYPNFRGFYNEKFKKDVREIKLKEEYRCSKCGAKIKIDNYEKTKKKLSYTSIYNHTVICGCFYI